MAKKTQSTELVQNGALDIEALVDGDTASLVSQAAPSDLAVLTASARMMPRVLTLEEGQMFEGVNLGHGAPIEPSDTRVGLDGQPPKPMKTWHLRHSSGAEVYLISSHQVDKDLTMLVGHRVVIIRGKQKRVGQRMVNQFLIYDKGKEPGYKVVEGRAVPVGDE